MGIAFSGIGALQLMFVRSELKDRFNSNEIRIEATIAGLGLYFFGLETIASKQVASPSAIRCRCT